jgi:hypothetical protein
MTLEPIQRRQFSDPDRAAVQEAVARAVEADPERFIDRYLGMEQSLGGRYVSADLFKETFEAYGSSKDSRNRYNAPVHNSAAVLASEYLRRLIGRPGEQERNSVILLTGIPGAGKTSSILRGGGLPVEVRAVYEGQLSSPETAFSKVQQIIDAGLKPAIVAVHVTPEQALQNTLRRFENIGRGASIGIMATIQGGLPDSLQIVRARFGAEVALQIVDRRIFHEPKELEGWQHLSLLRSEGSYEHIKQRLHQALEHHRSASGISEDAYGQALGRTPGPKYQAVDSSTRGWNEDPRHRRSGTPEDRQEDILKVTPAAPAPVSSSKLEPTTHQLRSEELRRQRREQWATQYGPDSQARKGAKDPKSGEHVEQNEENTPKPGKDIKESLRRDDDYGLWTSDVLIDSTLAAPW